MTRTTDSNEWLWCAWERARTDRRLTSFDLIYLIWLIRRAQLDGSSWSGGDSSARELDASRRTISRSRIRLEKAGYLRRAGTRNRCPILVVVGDVDGTRLHAPLREDLPGCEEEREMDLAAPAGQTERSPSRRPSRTPTATATLQPQPATTATRPRHPATGAAGKNGDCRR